MTLESGPVGGVVASVKAGEERGQENIIAADMGGTTFDVSVISGSQLPIRDSVVVEQHDLFLRMVDVESVGAGGGSLAWVDPQSGALRVGPQSAGALPGPVCYGRGGTVPTVTDADLVLGLLNPDNFLGGRMTPRRRGGPGRDHRSSARSSASGCSSARRASRRSPTA